VVEIGRETIERSKQGDAAEMGKYSLLGENLGRLDEETLSFIEVEKILSFSLPASARKHRAWWANDKSHSRTVDGWLSVGWVVKSVDLTRQVVTFMKSEKLKLDGGKSDLGKLRQEWIDRLKEIGSKLGFVCEEEVATNGGRVDLVWFYNFNLDLPGLGFKLPVVGFGVETSWRTKEAH